MRKKGVSRGMISLLCCNRGHVQSVNYLLWSLYVVTQNRNIILNINAWMLQGILWDVGHNVRTRRTLWPILEPSLAD